MKSIMARYLALPFLVVAIAGCQSGEEAARENLQKAFQEMGLAIERGDLEAFTAHYSESPLHLPPGAPMNSSRAEVRDFLQGKLGLYKIEDELTVRFSSDASMAYVFGTYSTEADPSQGRESVRGRFITIWQKNDEDQWECAVDIWNSEEPKFAHL